jgi:hypothetical protein
MTELNEEEINMYGDRCLDAYQKIDLLGKYLYLIEIFLYIKYKITFTF